MVGSLSPVSVDEKSTSKKSKGVILIASADDELRKRWTQALQGNFPIHEVSERTELEASLTNDKPSVLLLDLDLPRLREVGGVSALLRLSPSTNIILFASGHDDQAAMGALKAGAKGYCNKDTEPSLLKKAVSVVQKGEIWVGRKTIAHLLAEFTSLSESRQKNSPQLPEIYLNYLTPREQQIAILVGDGAHNKEIAYRLKISERTVKAHLTSIFQKLQIPDRLRLGLFVAGHKNKSNR
jgi:two-component system, NarL family, nitrate/nitrite response regulator NarL